MAEKKEEVAVFWFRRDLRLEDNTGLFHALSSGYRVLPLFIYDRNILDKLEKDDPRLPFIDDSLAQINQKLGKTGKGLYILYGFPAELFHSLAVTYDIKAVYANRDYEPYSIKRDNLIKDLLKDRGIPVFMFRDQVIFEGPDILKDDRTPYTVFTPYSRKWLREFRYELMEMVPSDRLLGNLLPSPGGSQVSSAEKGFRRSGITVKPFDLSRQRIGGYHMKRDFPHQEGTSGLGPYLRFGTVSIREVMRLTYGVNAVFTSELIWREFFMQILFHFPHVEENSFRPGYDRIAWINDEEYFRRWCEGTTGFPLVDAGMRELSLTGYMHNRVRMVTANFLTRLLLTDWRWGEAWFAGKLLDFDLSSNNGNWQWSAGSGCDASPWFRVFNPDTQIRKFDPDYLYVKKWIPEFGTAEYPEPVIDYATARARAIEYYGRSLRNL